MKCEACGEKMPDGATKCPECGDAPAGATGGKAAPKGKPAAKDELAKQFGTAKPGDGKPPEVPPLATWAKSRT